MTATLDGIRVVDLGLRVATAWCTRVLADYGAEVVCVEPETGHPLRSIAPFDSAGRSAAARYFLANKRSAAEAEKAGLIASADVIVTDALDAQELAAGNPGAIVCAITPHGLTGAYAKYPGNDLTAYARSGWAYANGLQGRAPLKGSGFQASSQAGTLAYGAIVCALIEKLAQEGDGQLIDISEFETLVSTSAPAPLRAQYSGFLWARRAEITMNEGPVPVKDGYFALPLSRPAFWVKAMNLLGLPDLAEDPELQEPGVRTKFADRYADRVGEAMRQWTRMDLFYGLADLRVIAGPALAIDEMGDNPQFEGREFFRTVGQTRYPGPFARMPESGWSLTQEMPEVASSTAEFTPAGDVSVSPVRAGGDEKGPLSGFRGLVLTQAWAGTYATELLAMLGAEVVQVEVRSRLDSWRGTYKNPIPRNLQGLPSAKHAWNCNPLYNSVNLNKRCITIDLSEPEGIELFRNLLPNFDFVAENFSPRVMGNLGLAYDDLVKIKPDVVLASLSAYGAVGPWANVPGIGGTIEPSSGMSSLLGYEGEHPQNSGQMYPDPVAGLCGFGAIATALLHRDRTGRGQYIDLSMQEANFTFIGDAWLEYEANGTVRGALGNRHSVHAPHGMYRCQGDDEWLALAAETDAQWASICDVLGIDGSRWPTAEQRKANERQIDALIDAATCNGDRITLADALSRVGVTAAPVLNPLEVVEDSVLRERGHMVEVDHPETGPVVQSGLPVLMSRTPGRVARHAPLQGEHSFEIFERFLGMSKDRYDALCDSGITGKGALSGGTKGALSGGTKGALSGGTKGAVSGGTKGAVSEVKKGALSEVEKGALSEVEKGAPKV